MGKGLAVAAFPLAGLAFVSLMIMGQKGTLWDATKVPAIPVPVCKFIEVPASGEEFYTIWLAPRAATAVSIYGECTGGTSVVFDFEIDSGSIDAVNGGDVTATCDAAGTTIGSPGGTTSMAAGDRLDIDLGTVAGDVDSFSACLQVTLD